MIPTDDRHFTARRYRMRHRTLYTYDEDVTGCYERGFLRPRSTPNQRVISNEIVVSPEPGILSEHVDFFGNNSFYIDIGTPHQALDIVQTSVLDVCWPRADIAHLNSWTVGEAAAIVAAGDGLDVVDTTTYLMPSALVDIGPDVVAYARTILKPDRPFGTAIEELTTAIFTGFRYAKGATSVKTTLPELIRLRAGVCQDFAHLAVGALRSVGLPARYVSGYIETFPPPGKPKLQGSDATHAWAAVMAPDGSWVDFDPTNNHLTDSRYLTTGWGRDFRDVSPLKGVIFTESQHSQLKVEVDVVRLDDDALPGV